MTAPGKQDPPIPARDGSLSSAAMTAPGKQDPPSSPRKPRYTLRPVVKPLRSAAGHAESTPAASRAENEDDDGYDPYSDFHDGNAGPLRFEADPWR